MFTISTLIGLKKVVAPRLHDYGFEYSGKLDSISWIFSLKFGDATQYITFEKLGANPHCMRVKFSTSVTLETLYHNELAKEIPYLLVYENKESYYIILEKLTDIIIQRGIVWLNIMSKPDIVPSKELYTLFMDQMSTRLSMLYNSNQFNFDDSYFIEEVEKKIREHSCEGANDPNWELIMDMAYALGEYVQKRLGGEWSLDGAFQRPFLIKIGGRDNVKSNILILIANYWGKPYYEPYSLSKWFNNIQRRIDMKF